MPARAIVIQEAASVPPVLALAADQVELDLECTTPRDAADLALTTAPHIVLIVVGPDVLTTAAAVADARPEAARVLLADDRSLPLAVDALNAAGAMAIGRLDGGAAGLAALLGRVLAEVHHRVDERRTVIALRAALDQARAALAHAEDRVVAVRGSIDVESGLWDTMRLVERLEDEANRLQRYGTPFGLLSVDAAGSSEGLEAAVGALLSEFVRRVDVCTRRGPGDLVVVCPVTDDAGMRRMGERFEQALLEGDLPEAPPGVAPPVRLATVGFERGPLRSDDILARLGAARERARSTGARAHG